MKKHFTLLFIVLLLIVPIIALSACGADDTSPNDNPSYDADRPHEHQWTDATCTTPKTCSLCGKTEGKLAEHALVTDPSVDPTCTEAGKTTGEHCSVCGEVVKQQTEINASGHSWQAATCIKAAYCTICGTESGAKLDHDFADATCQSPKICKRCETKEGSALPHDYADATCIEAKTCNNCGAKDGEPLGHTYSNNKCIRCKQVDPETVFENLVVIDSKYYTASDEKFTDSYGNTYDHANIYQYNTSSFGDKTTAYSIHNLNGKYKTLSGSFVAGSEMSMTAFIKIYVDDKLVFENTMTKTQGKVNFNINVQNASTVKICTGNSDRIYFKGNHTALVNVELTK